MSKVVTSITVFQDAVGLRLSATVTELNDSGTVIADNKRFDKVIVDASAKKSANALIAFAQSLAEQE